MNRYQSFTTIKSEGALLPTDFLQRLTRPDAPGVSPDSYHLARNERVTEAISRAWNRCVAAWAGFDDQREQVSDAGTTLTRERWLLILFQELGYGRLAAARGGLTAGGQTYPISHAWGNTPIHLVTFRQKLDRASTVETQVKRGPHVLLQSYLNASEQAQWGFVSNGLHLRLLRDNATLSRLSYIEFDLETMMRGGHYSDFAMLWLVCHQSRVEPLEEEAVATCRLEQWRQQADQQGTRALSELRNGVKAAIEHLGAGFLRHRANHALRAALADRSLSTADYYRQLLRLVYRLILLLVAEQRDLLLLPDAPVLARQTYTLYYSVTRLRELAQRRRGGGQPDLYYSLRLLFELLEAGYPALALPALGSRLFRAESTPALQGAELSNRALLEAIRALTLVRSDGMMRPVDYGNLGTEELGSVYEGLLTYRVILNGPESPFRLETAAGSVQKKVGAFFTHPDLVIALLDSALDPVIEARLKKAGRSREAQAEALLDIKVVDPACGMGNFLIGAARRLATRLAVIWAEDGMAEASPPLYREAMRLVVAQCIHGVDKDEDVVELCQLALWIETLQPGKPLTFLNANIRPGDSLVGVGPGMQITGILDAAFDRSDKESKAAGVALKKRNKVEREGQKQFWQVTAVIDSEEALAAWTAKRDALTRRLDTDAETVRIKERDFIASEYDPEYTRRRLAADLWTATFFWPLTEQGVGWSIPTHEAWYRVTTQDIESISSTLRSRIASLAQEHLFFHWELAFPHICNAQRHGFDVVLGNPPWERIKIQETEWFTANGRDDIANAPNAAVRRQMIAALYQEDFALFEAFHYALAKVEAVSHFVRTSKRFPLCGRGDINTYAVFGETARALIGEGGRAGIILQSDISTSDTYKFFFADILEKQQVVSFYDFVNTEKLFPGLDSRNPRFALMTLTKGRFNQPAIFSFWNTNARHLTDTTRHFTLTASDLDLVNPNTKTAPIFRTQRDAEITKAIYARVPVLIREATETQAEVNPWGISFQAMFHMSGDSGLFNTAVRLERAGAILTVNIYEGERERYLPLYEAKLIHHFDHRWATYRGTDTYDLAPTEKNNPSYLAQPRYWVPEVEVLYRTTPTPPDVIKAHRQGNKVALEQAVRNWLVHAPNVGIGTPLNESQQATLKKALSMGEMADAITIIMKERAPKWMLGWRDITNSTNERTVIAEIIPLYGTGNTIPVMFFGIKHTNLARSILANLSSFILDYCTRLKVGGTHLTYNYLKQLPILPPERYTQRCPWSLRETVGAWIAPRVLELTYTAWDLQAFAQDCGYYGPPFGWDEERRFQLRCELDAAFFHLYGIARDDVAYIMDTFPIVRRKDETAWGEYRTKRVILELYDEYGQATGDR